MHDYHDELEAKIASFERYLQLMVQRRAEERKSDCAITFMEEPPEDQDTDHLVESRAKVLEVIGSESNAASDQNSPGWQDDAILRIPEPSPPSSESGGSNGKRSDRYLQFAFMKRTFYIDIPNNTIFPAEVHRLLRDRSGFYYLHQRRWAFMTYEEWMELIRTHDPVQKEYLNADTRTAAQDMAYVFYTLWHFPLDWQFYYRALRFNRGKRRPWEGTGSVK